MAWWYPARYRQAVCYRAESLGIRVENIPQAA